MSNITHIKDVTDNAEGGILDFNSNGLTVAVSDTNIVIANPTFIDTSRGINIYNAGIVYVFDLNGVFLRTINSVSLTAEGYFGTCLAINGDKLVVTALKSDVEDGIGGVVYIFNIDGTLLHTAYSPSPNAKYEFGYSLAVTPTVIAVGSPGDSSGTGVGTVYLYDYSLVNFTDIPYIGSSRLGSSIAINGDKLLFNVIRTGNPQVVLLYDISDALSPQRLLTLTVPTGEADNRTFGDRVAMNSKNILVGAPGTAVEVNKPVGAVYMYGIDGTYIKRLISEAANSANFGDHIVMTENKFYIHETEATAKKGK